MLFGKTSCVILRLCSIEAMLVSRQDPQDLARGVSSGAFSPPVPGRGPCRSSRLPTGRPLKSLPRFSCPTLSPSLAFEALVRVFSHRFVGRARGVGSEENKPEGPGGAGDEHLRPARSVLRER